MIITVDNINKTYKNGSLELQVLKNISFKVDKGEFLAIMGSSGSGKSTMMNILGCLDNQYEGRYILDGIDISKSTENELSEIRNKKLVLYFNPLIFYQGLLHLKMLNYLWYIHQYQKKKGIKELMNF